MQQLERGNVVEALKAYFFKRWVPRALQGDECWLYAIDFEASSNFVVDRAAGLRGVIPLELGLIAFTLSGQWAQRGGAEGGRCC